MERPSTRNRRGRVSDTFRALGLSAAFVAPRAQQTHESTRIATTNGPSSQPTNLLLGSSSSSGLWESAVSTLSSKHRQVLQFREDSTRLPDHVIELVKMKQAICAEKHWKFTIKGKRSVLRDVAEKIIIWVDRFKVVGDLASQFDPVHAALPWAGFRFLLQVRSFPIC